MAVDSATLATASGILKEYYLPGIQDQINNPNAFMAELPKSSRDIIEGKYAVFALRMGVSQAIGARAELGVLPTAQRTRHVQARANLRYLYGTIRVSGPFLESSKTDRAAFIRGVRAESEGITESMKLDLNRQVYGNKDFNGEIARCGVTANALIVQLAVTSNMLYFEPEMIADLLTNSTGVAIGNGTAREIVAIDVANSRVTLDTPGGNVSTDGTVGLYRNGNRGNEITGLDAIIDDTLTNDIYNVDTDAAGNDRWRGNVNSAFGAFTLTKFQQELDDTHDQSGDWVSHIFSQSFARNLYLGKMQALRHAIAQEPAKKLNGGFTGLAYTGGGTEAVWVKDPYARATTIYGVTMKRLEWRRLKDFDFIQGIHGEIWLPDVYGASAADAYKAILHSYAEMVCLKRNAHFKLEAVSS